MRCEGVRCEGVRCEDVKCEGVRCEGVGNQWNWLPGPVGWDHHCMGPGTAAQQRPGPGREVRLQEGPPDGGSRPDLGPGVQGAAAQMASGAAATGALRSRSPSVEAPAPGCGEQGEKGGPTGRFRAGEELR